MIMINNTDHTRIPVFFRLLILLIMAGMQAGLSLHAAGAGETALQPGAEAGTEAEIIRQAEFIRPRRMIFLFQAPDESFSDLHRFLIYNSILTEIYDSNPEVVILESPQTDVPVTFDGKQELARSVDADSWVFVDVRGDINNVSYHYETFDLLNLETIGSGIRETGLRLDFRSMSRGFWEDLRESIQTGYQGLLDVQALTIRALPGTRLSGFGREELSLQGDSLTLELPNPAAYSYTAELPGYYPVTGDFYLGYEAAELSIPQQAAVRWGIEANINSLQFPGILGYYYLVPADIFLRAGITTYGLGIYLINNSPQLFRSNPLTSIQLQAGMYFLESQRMTRPYAALGGLVRLVHSDSYFGIDRLTPAAISVAAGVEHSLPSRRIRIFAEYMPLLYFSTDAYEFRDSSFPMYLYPDGRVPGYIFTSKLAFDLRNFTLGLRLKF